MIDNFRYSCPWEQFEEAVKILKDLIEQKKAYWLIGFMGNVEILLDVSEEQLPEEVENIIDDEIVYLMRGALINKDFNGESLKEGLFLHNPDASEEELDMFIMSFCNKLELVKDTFDIDRLSVRYKLKDKSINHKLSNFNFNIYTHNLSDDQNAKCALLNFSSKKDFGNAKEDEVSFICDAEDIDILIHLLQSVKDNMEED